MSNMAYMSAVGRRSARRRSSRSTSPTRTPCTCTPARAATTGRCSSCLPRRGEEGSSCSKVKIIQLILSSISASKDKAILTWACWILWIHKLDWRQCPFHFFWICFSFSCLFKMCQPMRAEIMVDRKYAELNPLNSRWIGLENMRMWEIRPETGNISRGGSSPSAAAAAAHHKVSKKLLWNGLPSCLTALIRGQRHH